MRAQRKKEVTLLNFGVAVNPGRFGRVSPRFRRVIRGRSGREACHSFGKPDLRAPATMTLKEKGSTLSRSRMAGHPHADTRLRSTILAYACCARNARTSGDQARQDRHAPGAQRSVFARKSRWNGVPAEWNGELLAMLIADPEGIATLPKERIPDAVGELERVKTALLARLYTSDGAPQQGGRPNLSQGYFTAKDVADLLNVSRKWVYAHRDELGGKKIGGAVRFPERAVRRYLERPR